MDIPGASAESSAGRSVVVSEAIDALRAWDPPLLTGVPLDIAEAARAQLAALALDGPRARGCALGRVAMSGRFRIEEAARAAQAASAAALRAERRNQRKVAKAAQAAKVSAPMQRKAYNRMPGVYGLLSAIARGAA